MSEWLKTGSCFGKRYLPYLLLPLQDVQTLLETIRLITYVMSGPMASLHRKTQGLAAELSPGAIDLHL